jgi:DNA primase
LEVESATKVEGGVEERTPVLAPAVPEPDAVPVSNAEKVFWPEEGYTKGDLVRYYRAVSRWLLPYLADRSVVLTRYRDGVHGKSFFQKDASSLVPPWLRTQGLWSAGAEREVGYFVCQSESALVYLVNLGAIPLHVWGSRIGSLELPDWCILDLDPKGAPFSHVVVVAREIRRLLVAPFSARPPAGAPVSMPLEWRAVNDRLDPAIFDIRTAPARMRKLEKDPMREVLELKPDLGDRCSCSTGSWTRAHQPNPISGGEPHARYLLWKVRTGPRCRDLARPRPGI